jgi:hypothetical protein
MRPAITGHEFGATSDVAHAVGRGIATDLPEPTWLKQTGQTSQRGRACSSRAYPGAYLGVERVQAGSATRCGAALAASMTSSVVRTPRV